MSDRLRMAEEAAEVLRAAAPGFGPRAFVVLGSGLAEALTSLEPVAEVPFAEVPGLVAATVPGHTGRFVLGRVGPTPVLAAFGRLHLYEGHPADRVALPVRAARLLGCHTLVVTNAAGAVREDLGPGEVVLITDHLDRTGASPLTGPGLEDLGPRFPSMAEAYTPRLARLAREVAAELGVPLREGVYAGVPGPAYETPAEVRALAASGADVVGMSTVTEVVAAVQAGMDVLGLSLVTNAAGGSSAHGHQDVLRAAAAGAPQLASLVLGILRGLP